MFWVIAQKPRSVQAAVCRESGIALHLIPIVNWLQQLSGQSSVCSAYMGLAFCNTTIPLTYGTSWKCIPDWVERKPGNTHGNKCSWKCRVWSGGKKKIVDHLPWIMDQSYGLHRSLWGDYLLLLSVEGPWNWELPPQKSDTLQFLCGLVYWLSTFIPLSFRLRHE